MTEVAYAVEGPTDVPVAERLISLVGYTPRGIFTALGKTKLDPKLPGYNRSARHRCWLVLRDLDSDDASSCVAEVISGLVGGTVTSKMALRLAVRSVESWLLADHEAFSKHFQISGARLPAMPDSLADPKQALVDACRSSKSGIIRAAVVPRRGNGRKVGVDYTSTIRGYVTDAWDLMRARVASPSLDRAILHLERLVATGAW